MARNVTRMCAVCREVKEKEQLIRIVKNKTGEISIDKTGKAEGRGAYICKDGICAKEAEKRKALERSFKTGNINKEIFLMLGHMESDSPMPN